MKITKANVGDRKIEQAAAHLRAAQAEQAKAERASQKEARRVQTTERPIAGQLRGPIVHKTAFQRDLMAAPDYLVPAKPRRVKPAVCN
jgi:hypothetical protein